MFIISFFYLKAIQNLFLKNYSSHKLNSNLRMALPVKGDVCKSIKNTCHYHHYHKRFNNLIKWVWLDESSLFIPCDLKLSYIKLYIIKSFLIISSKRKNWSITHFWRTGEYRDIKLKKNRSHHRSLIFYGVIAYYYENVHF